MTIATFKAAPSDASGNSPELLRLALRQVAGVVNGVLGGKLNCIGEVTLRESEATTTVTDARASFQSFIDFMPTTAAAASELADGLMYVSTRNNGSFVITHNNAAIAGRTFVYTVIG